MPNTDAKEGRRPENVPLVVEMRGSSSPTFSRLLVPVSGPSLRIYGHGESESCDALTQAGSGSGWVTSFVAEEPLPEQPLAARRSEACVNGQPGDDQRHEDALVRVPRRQVRR